MITSTILAIAALAGISTASSHYPGSHLRRSSHEQRSLATRAHTYKLVRESTGRGFFDDWDFFTSADPTHGQVQYVSGTEARSDGLIGFRKNSLAGRNATLAALTGAPVTAIMRVDERTKLASGKKRKSVRITSKEQFDQGVLILDLVKMPYGCSTWPAFWTVGSNWPNNGEIDIIEGVNLNTVNQMTLHATAGCTLSSHMAHGATGNVVATNCNANVNDNIGCGVQDSGDDSYGAGFNAAGGGVFAMQWTDGGIAVWRWKRSQIPSDVNAKKPNPTTWGAPAAFWSNSQCNMKKYVGPQTVVFDITLCGDWAGDSSVFASSGCPGTCQSCVANPDNFKNAFWEVASVRLYQ